MGGWGRNHRACGGVSAGGYLKIYIASFFDTRERIRPFADRLWGMGHEVVSTWLNEVAKPPFMSRDAFWRKLAVKDVVEVGSADLIITDTMDVTPRGGREFESGFAFASYQHKLWYVVGPVRNIFHTLADQRFDTWEEALSSLPKLPNKPENPSSP